MYSKAFQCIRSNHYLTTISKKKEKKIPQKFCLNNAADFFQGELVNAVIYSNGGKQLHNDDFH